MKKSCGCWRSTSRRPWNVSPTWKSSGEPRVRDRGRLQRDHRHQREAAAAESRGAPCAMSQFGTRTTPRPRGPPWSFMPRRATPMPIHCHPRWPCRPSDRAGSCPPSPPCPSRRAGVRGAGAAGLAAMARVWIRGLRARRRRARRAARPRAVAWPAAHRHGAARRGAPCPSARARSPRRSRSAARRRGCRQRISSLSSVSGTPVASVLGRGRATPCDCERGWTPVSRW